LQQKRWIANFEHLIEKIEDAYDLEEWVTWLKSKRETVLFEDLFRECGFAAEESFQ
jgi:hypothetical protein